MKFKIIGLILLGLLLMGIVGIWNYLDTFNVSKHQIEEINNNIQVEQSYLKDDLSTNTAKKSINLDYVLDGGPGKDGIPAINDPKFLKIEDVNNQTGLYDDILGISVVEGDESKFYPYSILYWHEIVNDVIGKKHVSVTFCPLCGTAIVYNRNIDGEIIEFGVSGKLYESNLLMYDDKNESLWSQSIGEAVIGDDLGKKLEVVKSDVMNFSQFKKNYPNGLVLSEETGFSRTYSRTPYGNYESKEQLYFPVQNTDEKLHQKELMYVIPFQGDSYVFVRSEIIKQKEIKYNIGEDVIIISYSNGEITAISGNQVIPGYVEMWFSWFTQHPENENVWLK